MLFRQRSRALKRVAKCRIFQGMFCLFKRVVLVKKFENAIFSRKTRVSDKDHMPRNDQNLLSQMFSFGVCFFWNVRFSREFFAFHKRWCCSKSLKMLYFSGNRAFQTKIACFETSCEMPDFPRNVLPFQEGGVGQKVRKCYIFQESARFRQGSHASKRPKSVEPNVLFWSVFFLECQIFQGIFCLGGVARKV